MILIALDVQVILDVPNVCRDTLLIILIIVSINVIQVNADIVQKIKFMEIHVLAVIQAILTIQV